MWDGKSSLLCLQTSERQNRMISLELGLSRNKEVVCDFKRWTHRSVDSSDVNLNRLVLTVCSVLGSHIKLCLFVFCPVQWKPLLQRRKCHVQRHRPVLGFRHEERRVPGVSGKCWRLVKDDQFSECLNIHTTLYAVRQWLSHFTCNWLAIKDCRSVLASMSRGH